MKTGDSVEIYRNITRKGLWFSVRDRRTGLVCHRFNIADGSKFTLKDCSFYVSLAGNARVRREGRKNVHALIRGVVWHNNFRGYPIKNYAKAKVSYNPYVNTRFQGKFIGFNKSSGLISADFVTLDSRGVIAYKKEM